MAAKTTESEGEREQDAQHGRCGEGLKSGLASVQDRDVCGYAAAAVIKQVAGAGRTHRERSCNWQLALFPHATSSRSSSGNSAHRHRCDVSILR